jgi:hypothetical protein
MATSEGRLTMCSSDENPVIDQQPAINGQQPATGEKPTTDEEPTTDLNPTTDEKAATDEEPTTRGNPQAGDDPPPDDQPSPLSQSADKQRQYSGPLRRKGALLPQISQLALEGHSCREIGARLGLGKTTISRWLNELRLERRTSLLDDTGMIVNTIARYDSIYREAMEAWRNSKADKEVRLVEDTEAAGKSAGSKTKKSVRTERRPGDIAFLTQARSAADAICKLAILKGGPLTWDTLRTEDFPNMSDAELTQVLNLLEQEKARLTKECEHLEEADGLPKPR